MPKILYNALHATHGVPEGGKKQKKCLGMTPIFLKVYTLRHLKKVEKKYLVFKILIFRLFNFFYHFIKSQNRHFLTPFLGAKKLLHVLYE